MPHVLKMPLYWLLSILIQIYHCSKQWVFRFTIVGWAPGQAATRDGRPLGMGGYRGRGPATGDGQPVSVDKATGMGGQHQPPGMGGHRGRAARHGGWAASHQEWAVRDGRPATGEGRRPATGDGWPPMDGPTGTGSLRDRQPPGTGGHGDGRPPDGPPSP
jgi:hypothetical protein